MRASILVSVMGGLCMASSAWAQATSIPIFTGQWTETFESVPLGQFVPCLDAGGNGDICSTSMHATTSWGYQCTIFPFAGSQFAASSNGIPTLTFIQPVSQFGGYFGTNSSATSAEFTFYDQYGAIVDQVVEPLGSCTWDWMGWAFPVPVYSITVEGLGASSGGYVDMDDVQMSATDDFDQDGFGAAEGDCDDADPSVYPGALELCDGIDNDCDGSPAYDESDLDADGLRICEGDCDDTDPDIPAAVESCNGQDDDCDGQLLTGEVDADGDGFLECEDDCDDSNPDLAPGAEEICDGMDNDCDGIIPLEEQDTDGDGFSSCEGDCDDTRASVFPGAVDAGADGIDQDCSGSDSTAIEGCGCDASGRPGGLAALGMIALLAVRRRRQIQRKNPRA